MVGILDSYYLTLYPTLYVLEILLECKDTIILPNTSFFL